MPGRVLRLPVRLLTLAFAISAIALSGTPAPAAALAPQVGATLLRVPPNVRAEGMGRAFAFLDRGPYAAWGNVGALDVRSGLEFAGTTGSLGASLAGNADYHFASAALGLPLGRRSLSVDLNYTRRDARGYAFFDGDALRSSRGPFQEAIGITGALSLSDRLSVGVGYKRLRIDERGRNGGCCGQAFQGTAHAYDMGLYATLPVGNDPAGSRRGEEPARLLLGVSLHNLGPDFRIRDAYGRFTAAAGRRRLPGALRVAIGGEWGVHPPTATRNTRSSNASPEPARVTVGLAMEKRLTPVDAESDPYGYSGGLARHQIVLSGGAEARVHDVIALRAGYIYGDTPDDDGVTVGAGLSWGRRAGLDIAAVPTGNDYDPRYSVWLNWPWPGQR